MALSGVAVAAVLLLWWIPAPALELQVKVVADDIGLELDNRWSLQDVPLERAQLTRFRDLQLRLGSDADSRDLRIVPGPGAPVSVADITSDYLRLNLDLGARSAVRLSATETPRTIKLVVPCKEGCGSLDVGPEVTFGCAGCASAEGAPLAPELIEGKARVKVSRREIQLVGDPLALTIRIGKEPGADALIAGQAARVRSVDFTHQRANGTASSITAEGTLAFPALKGDAIHIAPGDALIIEPASALSVRRLGLADNASLLVELEGQVRNVIVGSVGRPRSRMPSILASLYGSTDLQLLVAAVVTFAGVLNGLLYRLGYLDKGK